MGYCMSQTDANFFMKSDTHEDALKAIKKLMDQANSLGEGFNNNERQFSWVDKDVVMKAVNLREAMEEWGYEVEFDENYDIVGIEFTGEKMGQEEFLFDVIAPYVKEGSYIQMSGEDGEIWRWIFRENECHDVGATITFE